MGALTLVECQRSKLSKRSKSKINQRLECQHIPLRSLVSNQQLINIKIENFRSYDQREASFLVSNEIRGLKVN